MALFKTCFVEIWKWKWNEHEFVYVWAVSAADALEKDEGAEGEDGPEQEASANALLDLVNALDNVDLVTAWECCLATGFQADWLAIIFGYFCFSSLYFNMCSTSTSVSYAYL